MHKLGSFRIVDGDALTRLREMPDNSFDACLCDPPYGLSFMGNAWDHGVPAKETWAELLRVLKPGAHLLAFGGTRTHHRLMCAIEDAGFELRDCLMWLYGSGFPKSLDISKAIDKAAGNVRPVLASREEHNICRPDGGGDERLMTSGGKRETREVLTTAPGSAESAVWDGYGTALKPAWEPIILAMKPCEGTFAANALKHGVAGINVDAGRIGLNGEKAPTGSGDCRGRDVYAQDEWTRTRMANGGNETSALGRWPANVLLDEESAALLDAQTGELTSGANPERRGSDKFRETYSAFAGQRECDRARGADSGGASRFFYVAKADTDERFIGGERNTHPTVKPVDLCAYLAKLLLPPAGNRRLIVPFSGSGSEVMGALRSGWDEVVGIELDPQYVEMARRRIQGDAPLLNTEGVA